RRGVRGGPGFVADDRLERPEQLLLRVEPFDDRLDDEIATGEGVERIDRRQRGARALRGVRREPALVHELREGVVERGARRGERLWIRVEQSDGDAGLRE